MADTITNYKFPKRVRLTIGMVYLNSYRRNDDQGLIEKAQDVLSKHNIELDVFPDYSLRQKSSWNTIPYSQYINDDTQEYTTLYEVAKDKLKQMGCPFVNPQPVVFGEKVCGGYGIAPRVTKQTTPRLVMIQTSVNQDKMTLLHELGHAAELYHDLTPGLPRNFMHEADGREFIFKYQVEALCRSMFSVG
jgi:hypothetical protein